jgi:hypothetical protein
VRCASRRSSSVSAWGISAKSWFLLVGCFGVMKHNYLAVILVRDGCACRKLDPAVLMMKAAEDRLSSELAEPSNRPMARRILVQGQMRSKLVVVAGVRRKDLAQMGLAEDDDVIEAFPPDRADQSLRMTVLPR